MRLIFSDFDCKTFIFTGVILHWGIASCTCLILTKGCEYFDLKTEDRASRQELSLNLCSASISFLSFPSCSRFVSLKRWSVNPQLIIRLSYDLAELLLGCWKAINSFSVKSETSDKWYTSSAWECALLRIYVQACTHTHTCIHINTHSAHSSVQFMKYSRGYHLHEAAVLALVWLLVRGVLQHDFEASSSSGLSRIIHRQGSQLDVTSVYVDIYIHSTKHSLFSDI